MKVVRRKTEEDREDGLDWSAEGIARRRRQTDRLLRGKGGGTVGNLLQPPVSAVAGIFRDSSSGSQKQQLVCSKRVVEYTVTRVQFIGIINFR